MKNSIEVRGLEKVIRKYEKLGLDFNKAMKDVTLEAATYAHSKVPPYPAQPPDSSYTRTGTMGRKITPKIRKESETDWAGILGTPIEYAPWVISKTEAKNNAGGQAYMHKGRWWTLQNVVAGAKTGIVNVFKRGIKRILKEAGNVN